MNEHDDESRTSARSQGREIAWGVLVPTATLVFAAGTWGFSVFVDITDRISDMGLAIAANTEHRIAHDERSKHWISEIVRNRDDVRQLEQYVAELRSVPSARPDPFTGEDGRALQERIEQLEADQSE